MLIMMLIRINLILPRNPDSRLESGFLKALSKSQENPALVFKEASGEDELKAQGFPSSGLELGLDPGLVTNLVFRSETDRLFLFLFIFHFKGKGEVPAHFPDAEENNGLETALPLKLHPCLVADLACFGQKTFRLKTPAETEDRVRIKPQGISELVTVGQAPSASEHKALELFGFCL